MKNPTDSTAGCTVDRSWLTGREIASAISGLDQITFTFKDGKTLTVQASVYRGEPFLAFTPWKVD